MAYIIHFIKGFFIGIAKIIPGVSGAMLAMSFGVYDQSIYALRHLKENFLKNIFFLGSLGLGVLIAILCFSHMIAYLLEEYYLTTMLLFIGLILSGIPSVYRKIEVPFFRPRFLIPFLCAFSFVFLLSHFEFSTSAIHTSSPGMMFLFMLGIGIIDAATMIIPGISGTAIFMILGVYPFFLSMIQKLSDLSHIYSSMGTFGPYGIGLILGIITTVYIMEYLLKNHYQTTYCAILGFSLSSLFFLFLDTLLRNYTVTDIVAGLMCLVVGYYFGNKFENIT